MTLKAKKIPQDIFANRIEQAYKLLQKCTVCPRKCLVNRKKGEKGYCQADARLIVASSGPHFGEEPELVGIHGSGTIFLSGCNLRCVFCQNYTISHLLEGEEHSEDALAEVMLALQSKGCHNINFVTPTHFTPQIIKGIHIAIEKGLDLPIVYNCGGYESVETLHLLDGIVDIYMPDFKFWEPETAQKYANAPDYREIAQKAFAEMHRQVGDLKIDRYGRAQEGLLIRHLVMPGYMAESKQIMKYISSSLSKDSYVNIMDQYRPEFDAFNFPQIARKVSTAEFDEVIEFANEMGLHRGF